MSKPIRLIVGLGNPGAEYADTRHNAGFHFVDALAAKFGVRMSEDRKFQGEVGRLSLDGREVWLLKPSTYMNASGRSVVALALYYKILPDEILVVHDEMDIEPGLMRLKLGGGNAGHNGLKDISAQLSTPDFWRLRLGIGHPKKLGLVQEVAVFVLAAPSAEHREKIALCIDAGLGVIRDIVGGSIEKAVRTLAPFSGQKEKQKAARSASAPADPKVKGDRIIVSRCLLGYTCRYDGESRPSILEKLEAKGWTKDDIVTICPEMEGGLPCPREPAEIMAPGSDGHAVLAHEGAVVDRTGTAVTAQYLRGARKALKTAKAANAPFALLKARSPACSPAGIYDGSHTRTLVPGQGIAAALLAKNGFVLFSEEELDRIPAKRSES